MKKVAIIGGGEIGSAIASVLLTDSVEVNIWDKNEERNKSGLLLKEVVIDADYVFLMIPSLAVPEAFNAIRQYLSSHTAIVLISKALNEESGKTIIQVVRDLEFTGNVAFIGGPMIAEEIMENKGGVALLSSENQGLLNELADMIDNRKVTVEMNSDINSIALCSALKNVYAISLGFADGKGCGVNIKAYRTVQALQEMERLMEFLGEDERAVYGTAGMGDLLATGWSKSSSNRAAGEKLAISGEVVPNEGIISIRALSKLLGENNIVNFPLLSDLNTRINKNNK